MKSKKFFTFSFAAISLFGLGASIFSSRTSDYVAVKATSGENDQSKIVVGEEELNEAENPLTVAIVDTTTTAYGASFDLKFSTGEKAVRDEYGLFNIIDESGQLIETDEKITAMDKDSARKEYYEKLQNEEIDPIVISDCYIHSFVNVSKNQGKVIIPRTVYRGEGEDDEKFYYYGVISAIGSNSLSGNTKTKTLYIPNTIDSIPADAFTDGALTKIYCEVEEKPEGWADGWNNGVSVEWGVEDIYENAFADAEDYENVSFSYTVDVGNKDINYIIGNFPAEGQTQPIVVEYKLKNSAESRYQALDRKTKSTIYDGVGYYIYGYVNRLSVVIDLKKGEELDFDSVVVHNIFPALENDTNDPQYLPDMSKPLYAKPHKMFTKIYDLSEFMTISFDKISTFGDYVSIGTKIDIVNEGHVFEDLRPGQYSNYKNKIASGKAHIRARFTSLPLASYRIKVNGEETISSVSTPITQIVLDKYSGNRVNFLIKKDQLKNGFDLNTFEYFALENLVVSLDVVEGDTIIKRTVAHTKFGCVYFFTPDDQIKSFNGTLFLILLVAGYALGAAILSFTLFNVFKVKFKNDEFRRLKPKQFIKKAIIYSITSLAVVIFLAFVILRTTVLLSSIVVYNPLDVFITIFGIATIIIVGYYVKEIVAAVKTNKQRKKSIKLGLANDVADDGTK